MSSFFSSAPLPSEGPQLTPSTLPAPGPSIVPRPVDPKKPRRLSGILLIVALVAGSLGAWYWKSKADTKGSGTTIAAVATAVVSPGELQTTLRIAGTVAAQNYASIMAPRLQGNRGNFNRQGQGGPNGNNNDWALLLTKLAPAGSTVKMGDVVAEFDVQQQQQRLDDYKDTVLQLDASISSLKANLAASKEYLAQQVRVTKADWDKAVLDLQTAPIRSAIDAEKYKIAVDQAKEAYDELVKQAQLQEVSQTAQIKVSELDRDQSRIELERNQANIDRMRMKSPINGIAVLQTLFRQGQMAQVRVGDQPNPGQPFLSIVDPSSMVINATVNQVESEKIRLGQKARIRLDAYPDIELPGTVIGLGAMSKTSNIRASYVSEIPVRVKIDQAKVDTRIIPDLTASAEIILGSEENALLAPRGGIFEENGKPFAFVQGPAGWIRKNLELGLRSNTAVVVRSGLTKGDMIALQRPM